MRVARGASQIFPSLKFLEDDQDITVKELWSLNKWSVRSKFNLKHSERKRKTVAYCVGLPRSGTHSIAEVFSGQMCSAHEPYYAQTIFSILNYKLGSCSKDEFVKVMSARDQYMDLDLESAHYLHYVVDVLSDINEDSKFVLTVRDPITWIRSEMNKNFQTAGWKYWRLLEMYRYERDHNNITQGVYTIKSYLKYWKNHIRYVVENVPSDRLMVVDCGVLSDALTHVARFLGADEEAVRYVKHHHDKGLYEFDIFSHLTEVELRRVVREECTSFIEHYVPRLRCYL